MRRSRGRAALNERHERISGLVWGLLFISLGVILFLQQTGRLDLLGGPPGGGDGLTEHAAERVVDGDTETRWSSRFEDDQWIQIDLGSKVPIDRVRLLWEQAHARVYEIQLSDDGENWRTVVREEDSPGGTEEHAIGAEARYVRIFGEERATGYGISLWEVEVFGPPAADGEGEEAAPLLSAGRPVIASSRERTFVDQGGPVGSIVTFWFSWWPLFVIAAGLPHLLVPRSDGEELGGLVTVAVGVLFLLDNLDWTWQQAAPLVLVVAGIAVLTQGLRRGSREDGPPDGTSGTGSL